MPKKARSRSKSRRKPRRSKSKSRRKPRRSKSKSRRKPRRSRSKSRRKPRRSRSKSRRKPRRSRSKSRRKPRRSRSKSRRKPRRKPRRSRSKSRGQSEYMIERPNIILRSEVEDKLEKINEVYDEKEYISDDNKNTLEELYNDIQIQSEDDINVDLNAFIGFYEGGKIENLLKNNSLVSFFGTVLFRTLEDLDDEGEFEKAEKLRKKVRTLLSKIQL